MTNLNQAYLNKKEFLIIGENKTLKKRVFLVVQMVKNLPAMQGTQVQSWDWEYPWRREWLPSPVFLPGKIHGQSSLASYGPLGHQQWDMTEWITLTLTLFRHKERMRTSLVVQWLRLHAPSAQGQVQSLLRALDPRCSNERSCKQFSSDPQLCQTLWPHRLQHI